MPALVTEMSTAKKALQLYLLFCAFAYLELDNAHPHYVRCSSGPLTNYIKETISRQWM